MTGRGTRDMHRDMTWGDERCLTVTSCADTSDIWNDFLQDSDSGGDDQRTSSISLDILAFVHQRWRCQLPSQSMFP